MFKNLFSFCKLFLTIVIISSCSTSIRRSEQGNFSGIEDDKSPVEQETSRFVEYDVPPVVIRRTPPVYSPFARREGIQGQVLLDVEILKDGSVGRVKVVRSLMAGKGGLDEAAIKAVKQWKFEPAKSGGTPISVWARIPVDFRLR